jgi:hypothetical protein
MKIRETLLVTDDARRCIAANMKKDNLPYLATQDGLATRASVVKWLQAALDKANALGSPEFKLDALEREETRLAVEQLRAAGWRDSRIRSWLLKQAALMEGVKLELWEKPLLSVEKDGELPGAQPTA